MQSFSKNKEYVMICVDNSDLFNTIYSPMFEAIEAVSYSIISENDERLSARDFNCVAIMELSSNPRIIGTFTRDLDIIRESLKSIETKSGMNFIRGIETAISELLVKRDSDYGLKSDYQIRMSIIVFVCTPIQSNQKELEVLAETLRELNISVDIVNFGNNSIVNKQKFEAFIKILNPTSRLYSIENPQMLKIALNGSDLIKGNQITSNQYFANFEKVPDIEWEEWQIEKAIEESLKDCKSGNNSKFSEPNIMSEKEQLALAIKLSLLTTNGNSEQTEKSSNSSDKKVKKKKFIEGKKEPK